MTTNSEAARATERPVAGTWTIDAVHSFTSFTVEHFTIAVARGIGAGPKGTITIAEHLADSSVTASIDAKTITTANPARDEKVLGPDVLDVENFPTIDFVSTGLHLGEGPQHALEGTLTMRGVTRPITLDVLYRGFVTDVWSKERLGMTVTTEIKRSDFGAGDWGHVALAAGGFMVPDTVRITMEIEATLDVPEAAGA